MPNASYTKRLAFIKKILSNHNNMNEIKTLNNFYTAYCNMNLNEISKFYHSEIEFYDHAFGILNKKELMTMWSMLFNRVKVSNVRIENGIGYSHIDCYYTYILTGRKVYNSIETTIKFKDNLIIKQTDIFSLKKWAKQSLGWKEGLIANTSFFKNKLQKQTKKALMKYAESANKTNANKV